MITKEVQFMGDTLLTIKDNDKVYVGIRWVCQGLGLSSGQRNHQQSKIQRDCILSQGVRKIVPPKNTGFPEVICLDITYLPLWLAKINANIVKEDIRGKLVSYQLRAKEVLADAFVSHVTPQANHIIPQVPQSFQEALRMLADSFDERNKLLPKATKFDKFTKSKGSRTMSQVAKVLNTGRNKLFAALRAKKILMKNNEPYQKYINMGYFDVKEYVGNNYVAPRTLVKPRGVSFISEVMGEA